MDRVKPFTKSQLAGLQKIAAITDSAGLINVALVVCGARDACICGTESRSLPNMDDMPLEDIEKLSGKLTSETLSKTFPELGSIQTCHEFLCYHKKRVAKSDLDIIRNDDTAAYHAVTGKVLGYAGTAFPAGKHKNVVVIYTIAIDTRGRQHDLMGFGAFLREVPEAIRLHEEFRRRGRAVIGVTLAKGLIVRDFVLAIKAPSVRPKGRG